jgi:hypothetical protein
MFGALYIAIWILMLPRLGAATVTVLRQMTCPTALRQALTARQALVGPEERH